MIDLECVVTFLAVVNHGGFREASKHTGLAQPTVSQHIKRLEHSLNASLIQRSNAGCKLSHKGHQFLPYAQQLMRIHERIEASFIETELLVGASSNAGIYLLQPYIKAYWDMHVKSHPDSQLQPPPLKLSIGSNTDVMKRLNNYEIDVAVLEWWDHRPGYQARLWRSEELVAIVPISHPWAKRSSIPSAWIKGHALLGGEAGSGTGRLLREYWGKDADTISISMQLGSTEAVKNAVQAGLGISLVMACSVEDEVQSGRLVALHFDDKPPAKNLYLISRQDSALNLNASKFIDFLCRQGEILKTNNSFVQMLEKDAF